MSNPATRACVCYHAAYRPMETNHAKLSYLLLAILVVGSLLFYVASTAATFDQFLNPNRARPPFDYSRNSRFLMQPMPESQRAGMRAEDEIISVNGVPFTRYGRAD